MSTVNKKTRLKLSNQSLVWEIFGDNEKLTIVEILDRVNDKLKAQTEPDEKFVRMADSTLRRAIAELVDKGQLKPFGRQGNAALYGKPSAGIGDADQQLIPFAGELKSVQEFLQIMTDPEGRPLTRKTSIIGEKTQQRIRRQLAFVVMSSGEPGHFQTVKELNVSLHDLSKDLAYIQNVIQSFLDSPVWYEQYRDQIAYALRKMQERDPEFYQLVIDYIRSES